MPIFEPPPGFVDLLSDAEDAPDRGVWCDLEVPGVGTVRARRPRPKSAAALAMSVSEDHLVPADVAELDAKEREHALERQQGRYRTEFVRDHLADGEFDRLMTDMMDPDLDLPGDTMGRVARCIATWGTPRPYIAVLSLALESARHWRALRFKIQTCGIADPMRLPSLHSVLDHMEQLALESFDHDDKGRAERDQWIGRLYRPDPPMPGAKAAAKELPPPVPAGFSPEETRQSFAALARAAR